MPSQLTPDQWKDFNSKMKWDCQVALRGPDVRNSSMIKHFTTSVIRAELAPVMRVGGSINEEFRFVILPSLDYSKDGLKDDRSLLRVDLSHFSSHVHVAACHLGIPVWQVPTQKWLAATTEGLPLYQAFLLFGESLPDGAAKDYCLAKGRECKERHDAYEARVAQQRKEQRPRPRSPRPAFYVEEN